MDQPFNRAALDKLKVRIQALRAKTIDNGCTEDEALSAATKVAELLDRHDLSLTDVELRAAHCERRVYETHRRKRIPLDDCVGAIAHFCDCRVWREKNSVGESSYVFFGLRSDIEVAHYLAELIDTAVRTELGRFKTSDDYSQFRHQERHLANASFALGMVASIADRLVAIKASRDSGNRSTGRGLVLLKTSVVDAEFDKLDLKLRTQRSNSRTVSTTAYEAGGAAGASLAISPGISQMPPRDPVQKATEHRPKAENVRPPFLSHRQNGRWRDFSARYRRQKSPILAGFFHFGSGPRNRARGRFFSEWAVFLRTSGLRGFSTV